MTKSRGDQWVNKEAMWLLETVDKLDSHRARVARADREAPPKAEWSSATIRKGHFCFHFVIILHFHF